jgi:hypothetical protein
MRQLLFALGLLAIFGLAFVGCSGSGSSPPVDAGQVTPDSGSTNHIDAGSSFDAGSSLDAGITTDAGSIPDAGEPVDAGTTLDAGADVDAGTSVDAGELVDAGANVDAGEFVDAGPSPDAGALHLALTGCPQAGYAGTFLVGGSPFSLVVDTGSAELGVASSSCSSCGVTPLYTPGSSATDQGQSVTVSYVSGGGWSGEVYRDLLGVPGQSFVAPMNLIAIGSQSGGFFTGNSGCAFGSVPFTFEGIAGFGPASLAESGTDEPMAAIAQAGLPDVFSIALCNSTGDMWLGGFDSSVVSAPPVYTPLIAASYYTVRMNDMQVGTTDLGLTSNDIGDVVVDSDTTEFELPSSVYDSLRDAIGGTSAFQQHFGTASWFDNGYCTTPLDAITPTPAQLDAVLPPLTLELDDGSGGQVPVTLGATESYLMPVDDQGVVYYCPEIEPRILGGSTVLGSAAVRGELVIVDRAGGRIGFAPYNGCTSP